MTATPRPNRNGAAGATTAKAPARRPAGAPKGPMTLAIDIGGSGLKASVLDAGGTMTAARVRVDTTYPMPPERLVETLRTLVEPLPAYERISAGFPGMVRAGRVLSAPHFVTASGPGSKVKASLQKAWDHFDLAGALTDTLGHPAKVVNDAELQGAADVKGQGLELVVTLGTGVGTAVFTDGRIAPHLELAHHPFRKGETYNEQLGEAARKRVGKRTWNRRVKIAIDTLDALLFFDHVYIGGGNAQKVTVDLGPKATIGDNTGGILGGILLWGDRPVL